MENRIWDPSGKLVAKLLDAEVRDLIGASRGEVRAQVAVDELAIPVKFGMLLDIASYGGRALENTGRLSPEQIELIARTVRRVPEVMVNVSGGGSSAKAVAAHFRYIDRPAVKSILKPTTASRCGGRASNRISWPTGIWTPMPPSRARPIPARPVANL